MSAAATPVVLSRLKRRGDFLRVAAERRKWVTPGLILQAALTPASHRVNMASASDSESGLPDPTALPSARVGFTVSKKVGNAVARNRARRRLRAAVDQLMPLLAQDGTDYVLIGRPATVDRPFDALLKDLKSALTRIVSVAPGSDPLPPRHKGRGSKSRNTKPHHGRGKGHETGRPDADRGTPPAGPAPESGD